jgi:hypothetical protein
MLCYILGQRSPKGVIHALPIGIRILANAELPGKGRRTGLDDNNTLFEREKSHSSPSVRSRKALAVSPTQWTKGVIRAIFLATTPPDQEEAFADCEAILTVDAWSAYISIPQTPCQAHVHEMLLMSMILSMIVSLVVLMRSQMYNRRHIITKALKP